MNGNNHMRSRNAVGNNSFSDLPRGGVALDVDDLEMASSRGKMVATDLTKMNPLARCIISTDKKVLGLVVMTFYLIVLFLGLKTSYIGACVLLICAAMLCFSVWLAKWVINRGEGTEKMRGVSNAIRDGAEGYFTTQYGTIGRMSVVLTVVIYITYMFRRVTQEQEESGMTRGVLAVLTSLSFVLGAFCSAVAGYVGMWVSVRANVRVAGAARNSASEALQVALRAGGFSALVVVGMTVLGVCSLFSGFCVFFGVHQGKVPVDQIPLLLVGYGFGASFVALFAQLGGGIYTKAADVGADLVGKIEQDIPEDDPRNPAVIADLVGDNVGDCAARGADLFESIAAEIISAMILGGTMAKKSNLKNPIGFIMFPLVVHSLDLVVSAVGILSVNGSASKTQSTYDIMKKGYTVSIVLAAIGFFITCRTLLYDDSAPQAWLYFSGCGMVGIACSYAFVFISQYYTDYKYAPVRKIAEASTTGHGTNIIAGVGVGMEATAMPVIVISIAVTAAYWFGKMSGLQDDQGEPTGGLFGTAVACMGMLSTAAYVLTMDIFGPIADNAGGIVEMSDEPESVRTITDELDAVGNTTKATTKGYAIGSAALAAFLLFSAYMDEVSAFNGEKFEVVDIAIPEVWIGGLLGSMLVYLFSAWACAAVGNSAQEVVIEVRRQFAEKPGIMTYQEMPDYARCVSIVAASALREMKKPGLLAVGAPIVVGVTFRIFGKATGQTMLGAKVVAGMIMFATVSGILMALFLNTAGGAWDNAKKYVELGAHGGKGSEAHKASITGDTVGDPFKDTAGPSIHVLIKMLATITLVMAPLFLD
jgi:inorganic pyrophosphatase